MNNRLSKKIPYNKAIAALAVIATLSGVLTVFVGEILLPVAAAVLSSLMLFERGPKKPISISISSLVFLVDMVLGIFIRSYAPLASIEIVLIAFLVFHLYKKRVGKAETAFYVSAAAALMLALSLVFLAFEQTGVYTIASVYEYYSGVYASLEKAVVDQLVAFTVTTSGGAVESVFTPESAKALFEEIMSSLVSCGILVSFLIAGVTLKIFTAVVSRCAEDRSFVVSWRFVASNTVAYFYVALVFISFFAGGGTDTFSLTVANLQTVFMFVFAYSGFGHLFRALSAKRSPFFAFVLLVIGILLLSSLALTLLSIYGVISTITYNKSKNVKDAK